MVETPGDYSWSSYRSNALGNEDSILSAHAEYWPSVARSLGRYLQTGTAEEACRGKTVWRVGMSGISCLTKALRDDDDGPGQLNGDLLNRSLQLT